MGQYQEWLHCRGVNQQLQAQLEALERDLAQLQEHAHILEQSMGTSNHVISPETSPQLFLQVDNQIIHALITSLNEHLFLTPDAALETASDTPSETISPAFLAWSNLPNFETQEVPGGLPPTPIFTQTRQREIADYFQVDPLLDQPVPATPHPEMALSAADMATFSDQQDQTEPQLEIPRWLRNITQARHRDGPTDKETMRTNRLVQRWVERWGHPSQGQESVTASSFAQPARKESAPIRASNDAAFHLPQGGVAEREQVDKNSASSFAQPARKESTKEGQQ